MVVVSVFCIETIGLLCCRIVVHYREALARLTRILDVQGQSLENLSAANESFIQHLPEMREESAGKERFRITRELHDSLGYAMTNIVMIMNAVQYIYKKEPEKVRDYCLKTKKMASVTMDEIRRTLYRLRALRRDTPRDPSIFFIKLCRDFQEATGVQTECHPGNLDRVLPERVFNTLFRTVQVGFINALKHGNAGKITLHFWIGDQDLRMTIWNSIENADFALDTIREGIGLKGVRERIADLEGEIQIHQPPDGFSLIVIIPKKELVDADHDDHDS